MAKKILVLNMNAQLSTPDRVNSSLRRQTTSIQQLQSPEAIRNLGEKSVHVGLKYRVSSAENERRFSLDKQESVT